MMPALQPRGVLCCMGPQLLRLHTSVQPCPQPRELAHPRPPRCSSFHSALPYLRSAEYLCALPSSEPNQNSLEFYPSSETLGKCRASVLLLSTWRWQIQLTAQGTTDIRTHAGAWHVLGPQQVQLILVCLLLPRWLLLLLVVVLISQQEMVFKVTELPMLLRDKQEGQERSEAELESETQRIPGRPKAPGGRGHGSNVHTHDSIHSFSLLLIFWTHLMGQALGQVPSARGLGPKLVQSMFVDQSMASPIWLATGNLGQGWGLERIS